jgi:hypothetical protein
MAAEPHARVSEGTIWGRNGKNKLPLTGAMRWWREVGDRRTRRVRLGEHAVHGWIDAEENAIEFMAKLRQHDDALLNRTIDEGEWLEIQGIGVEDRGHRLFALIYQQ